MKGFKPTGNGPKYGNFTFPSKAGFGPSSGKVETISSYTRRVPKSGGRTDFAKGGKVGNLKRLGAFRQKIELSPKSESNMLDAIAGHHKTEAKTSVSVPKVAARTKGPAPQKFAHGGAVRREPASPQFIEKCAPLKGGHCAELRTKPVTDFDKVHGGKGPLKPGYAEGGKVSSIGTAIKLMKQLIAQGNSHDAAVDKAARRFNVDRSDLKGAEFRPTESAQVLARGGKVGGMGRVLSGAIARAAPQATAAPVAMGPKSGPRFMNAGPNKGPAQAMTAPVRAPGRVATPATGFGSFRRRPMIR